MSSSNAAVAESPLLPRGVWVAPWLFGGHPVYVAVDTHGEAVAWSACLPEQPPADVQASLWAGLDQKDPLPGAAQPAPFLRLTL